MQLYKIVYIFIHRHEGIENKYIYNETIFRSSVAIKTNMKRYKDFMAHIERKASDKT